MSSHLRTRCSSLCFGPAVIALAAFAAGTTAAQEGGPYPTGLPTYAKPATTLLPPADSSGREALATKYTEVGANFLGSFLAYRAQGPGDWLTQEFNVAGNGKYEVSIWMAKGPKCGMYVVLLDGQRVGPEHDGYNAEPQGPQAMDLGELDLTAGLHRVKFLVTGRNKDATGYELWIDAYVVRTKPEGRFIKLWEVAGPFGGDAMAATAPPENAFWRQVTTDRNGRLDFVKWMGEADNVAAWARATITSPDDRDTTLWVGSDDGVAVWLNGTKVYEYLKARPALPDQDQVKVHLRQGENQLLVRVNNISLGWELLVRPEDPKGELGIPGAEKEVRKLLPEARQEGFPAEQPQGNLQKKAPEAEQGAGAADKPEEGAGRVQPEEKPEADEQKPANEE